MTTFTAPLKVRGLDNLTTVTANDEPANTSLYIINRGDAAAFSISTSANAVTAATAQNARVQTVFTGFIKIMISGVTGYVPYAVN